MRGAVFGVLLFCFFAGCAIAQECPCGDKAPSEKFTCQQQRDFGQCEKDWMKNGGFCQCSCGRCEMVETKEPELVLVDNLPVKPLKKPEIKEESEIDEDVKKESEDEGMMEGTKVPRESKALKPLKKLENKKCTATPADVIGLASELTSFSTLLGGTEIFEVLNDTKAELTVFAPTNKAIEELGVEISELELRPELTAALIGYHVVPQLITAKRLAKPAKIATLTGINLFGGSSREIEGVGSSAKIIGSPVQVCDSLIYLIKEVLFPAATLDEIEVLNTAENPMAEEDSTTIKKADCVEDVDAFHSISSDEELSMFAEALNAAQLSESLATPESNFTILAPTNTAFKEAMEILGEPFESLIGDTDTLKGILQYHIIEGNIERSDFIEGLIATLNTSLYVELDSGVEFAGIENSAALTEADIDLSCNSAVHKVDAVLLPYKLNASGVIATSRAAIVGGRKQSSKKTVTTKRKARKIGAAKDRTRRNSFSLYRVLSQTPQLKIFGQVIQLSNMVSILNDKSIQVTIFAPVDYAFGNLLEEGHGFFDLIPDQSIADVLVSYHTAAAPVSSSYLRDGQEPATMLMYKGKPMKLEIVDDNESPTKLAVKGASSKANIIQTDIIGSNSVVHIIDSVLLPSAKLLPRGNVSLQTALKTTAKFKPQWT